MSAPAVHGRGWRWVRRGFLPASVALLVLAGALVPLPAYIEMPGSAVGVPACVAIDERPDAAVSGDFLLTTVGQRDATVFGMMVAAARDDQAVVSKGTLLGGVRRDRYLQRQRRTFVDATDRAVVVGLRAAGLTVDVRGEGVDVVEVLEGTAADGVLRPGDVITAVDGAPVTTDAELIDAVADVEPLELRVRRDDAVRTANVTPQLTDTDDGPRPMMGVRISTHAPRVELPLGIDVASGRIGGPSAGLMIGLAVFDLVDAGDLAAGRRVAGTGTLALDGSVGPISGIALKVAAAARERADVFVAPAAQVATARAAVPADSGMVVVPATTFDEARRALGAVDAAASGAAATPGCAFVPDA